MFTLIAIAIAFFLVFLGFCVSSTPLTYQGRLKIYIVNLIMKIINMLPSQVKVSLDSWYNYTMNQPNPIVQILYVMLVIGLFTFYYTYGIETFFPHRIISKNYCFFGYVIVAFCLYVFYLTCVNGPGVIDKKNLNILKIKYSKPSLLNTNPDTECKTCKIPILARNRHCIICNICIEKFDHHCIWVNQCIGAKNYRFFLLFLLSHLILTTYGAILGIAILYYYIIDHNLLKASFFNKHTNEKVDSSYMVVFKFVIGQNYAFFATIVMLVTISITLLVFIIYHLNLIKMNFTTTERNKQVKCIRYMDLIKKTLLLVCRDKKYTTKFKELTTEDIIKYKHIAFNEPEYDLDKLSEEEVNNFYNFADQSIALYRINPYSKGFLKNFIDIIKGI